MHRPQFFCSVLGEHDGEEHLEVLLGENGMGLLGGHDQRLAGVEVVDRAVHGELAEALQYRESDYLRR